MRSGDNRVTINFEDVSIKFKNHKCFGDDFQELNSMKPVNIIIGRNNSGKSSLLDLIGYLFNPSNFQSVPHEKKYTEVYYTMTLNEENLHNGIDHSKFGKGFIGSRITFSHSGNLKKVTKLDPPLEIDNLKELENQLEHRVLSPFDGKVFLRLRAERNIIPEDRSTREDAVIKENGDLATQIIEIFINNSLFDRGRVTKVLLDDLNKIVGPDSHFEEIQVRRTGDVWEIFLKDDKGEIPLSNSGSGLKTILLVLINILLVPKYQLEKYIYGFEELENSLHPALQRKLFSYIRDIALKEHAHFFITTHSNVVIDLFGKDENAQIYHVTHDGKKSIVEPVKTYIGKSAILNDLDIRASDLLQSNGIIWVEGPSDRIYINKWIELWSGGTLQEGAEYQCLFYGGRLLKHLSANPPEEEMKNLIKILLANRNAAILIDCDKKTPDTKINDTKLRLCQEIETIKGMCWITSGRVIETYIPKSAISKYYNESVEKEIDPFDKFEDYLESIKSGERSRFIANKVKFAEEIIQYLTMSDLKVILDLDSKMKELIKLINKWNNKK
jgi:predicted ATP-dependent endonuclease of OLD family